MNTELFTMKSRVEFEWKSLSQKKYKYDLT